MEEETINDFDLNVSTEELEARECDDVSNSVGNEVGEDNEVTENIDEDDGLENGGIIHEVLIRVSYKIFSLGGGRIFSEIFPEVDNLAKILLALPVGTATVERSFSHMKMIETRLRNRLSDENLTHLMRIAIEGPDLSEVNLNEILNIFKEKNRRIRL